MTALPDPLPLAEAQAKLLGAIEPLGREELPLEQAVGRFLVDEVVARRTQPPADLSAMDGFAIRSADKGPWKIIGESAAGHPFDGALKSGEAIKISTGAHMPDGADAVLIKENAHAEGEKLSLTAQMPDSGKHVRNKGFDFHEGQQVFNAGDTIGAAEIALAMSAGHLNLPCGRLPRVAILDTGDELTLEAETAPPEKIPASNGAMLSAMVRDLAKDVTRLGPVADDAGALQQALQSADDCDVLITSGGASVGDHDLVKPALEAWGAELAFWRVLMKPGKPIMIARRGPQWIFGLPGNPVSSFVTAFLFVVPALRKLAGSGDPLDRWVSAVLQGTLPPTGQRLELPRGIWNGCNVMPRSEQDSSGLRALSGSNCLILRPPNCHEALDGTHVEIYPFGRPRLT